MMTGVTEYQSRDAQAETLADIVATALHGQISENGRATLAVAGGSTPTAFLKALGRRRIDWSSVTVLPTDERWAPPDHPRSNERMIREALLADGARPSVFSFWRAGQTAAQAAPDVAAALAQHLPLDICVLGMGADMHCASLFPGGDTLEAAMTPGGPTVNAITAPGAAEPRLTLSADVLAAGDLHVLISGDDKRTALTAALEADTGLAAPIVGVLGRNERAVAHWAP